MDGIKLRSWARRVTAVAVALSAPTFAQYGQSSPYGRGPAYPPHMSGMYQPAEGRLSASPAGYVNPWAPRPQMVVVPVSYLNRLAAAQDGLNLRGAPSPLPTNPGAAMRHPSPESMPAGISNTMTPKANATGKAIVGSIRQNAPTTISSTPSSSSPIVLDESMHKVIEANPPAKIVIDGSTSTADVPTLPGEHPANSMGVISSTPIVVDEDGWMSSGAGCSTGECVSAPVVGQACQLCVNKDPVWKASIASVFLRRDRTEPTPLVLRTQSQNTFVSANEVFNADQLDFDRELGMSASIQRKIGCDTWFEAGFLGLLDNSFDSTALILGDNDLRLPGDLGLSTLDFFAADVFLIEQNTRFNTAELNIRKGKNVQMIAGARWIGLVDELNITAFDNDTGISAFRVATINNIVGAQLGLAAQKQFGRLSVDGFGKAGLGVNFANQSQFGQDFRNQLTIRDAESNSDGAAAFAEVGLFSGYQINQHLKVRGGYRLFWIGGLATAQGQLDFGFNPDSGFGIHHRNAVFIHGFEGGLELTW